MVKKNFVLGIVVTVICFLQVVILIKMNEIRATIAQFSARSVIEETEKETAFDTSDIEGQTPPVYSDMTNVIGKNANKN